MIYTIKIDLIEAISFKSLKEKKEVVQRIIYDETKSGDAPKIIKHILSDLLDSEEEFDNRKNVVMALKTLIKELK